MNIIEKKFDIIPEDTFIPQQEIEFCKDILGDQIADESLIIVPYNFSNLRRTGMLLSEDQIIYNIYYYYKSLKKTKILFFEYPESFEKRTLQLMFKTIDVFVNEYKLNRNIFSYFNGAYPVVENVKKYKTICKTNNYTPIPLYLYNHFEQQVRSCLVNDGVGNLVSKKNNNPEYVVLFLNGSPRYHRLYLLASLIKSKVIDKVLYSMHYFDPKNYEVIKDLLEYITPEYSPRELTLSSGDRENVKNISKNDLNLYEKTYISLIAETIFFSNKKINKSNYSGESPNLDSIFFTEKTFRAIACKHPFIIASRPNYLKTLRKIGYKTFDPYIDESYDDIEDDIERLEKIAEIVTDLCNKDKKFWDEFLIYTKDIIEHNYQHLLNNKRVLLKSGFNESSKSSL